MKRRGFYILIIIIIYSRYVKLHMQRYVSKCPVLRLATRATFIHPQKMNWVGLPTRSCKNKEMKK